jgi:hypothetical protein
MLPTINSKQELFILISIGTIKEEILELGLLRNTLKMIKKPEIIDMRR